MNDKVTYLKGTHGQVPVRLYLVRNKYYAFFPFDQCLKDDIKAMAGSRWDPEQECWVFRKCRRNDFQLAYLMGVPVYEPYDCELLAVEKTVKDRPLFPHQWQILSFILTRKQCIVAAEMGTGKSLAAIETLERVLLREAPWWVAPRLTLSTVRLELEKWECNVEPQLLTYNKMVQEMDKNRASVPNVVIFDESSKLKGPTTQRTASAIKLGNRMREVHGEDTYIVLLSGRPAPNAPIDWWAQAEIACPGFLREGKFGMFEDRLCLKQEAKRMDGAKFRKLVTWWDDNKKCNKCGIHADAHPRESAHPWIPSVNEVAKLEKRLQGLVLPIFKKDHLDSLPEKNYVRLHTKSNPRLDMLAKQIRRECVTSGDLLYRLRALSDGYLVSDKQTGSTKQCGGCHGVGWVPDVGDNVTCQLCQGQGELPVTERVYKPVNSPKLATFTDILENYFEHGRLIAWAPLHGTLDLLRQTAVKYGWDVLQFDGRKCALHSVEIALTRQEDLLQHFQEGSRDHPCLFVGNPEAAGMGLTLTAAEAMVFYSNSWKPEARQQAEDRNHRPGARGCKIYDICCMPIDDVIREALMNKEKLQDLSLGKLVEALDNVAA